MALGNILVTPRDVRRAIWLLWAFAGGSAFVSIVSSMTGASDIGLVGNVGIEGLEVDTSGIRGAMVFGAILFAGVSLGSRAYLIRKTEIGRDWARIMLVIDCVISVLGFLIWAAMGEGTLISAVVWIALNVIYGAAIYLLYSMHAIVWFRELRRD